MIRSLGETTSGAETGQGRGGNFAHGDALTDLSADQWRLAKTIFDEAVDWPPEDRDSRLRTLTDDPEVLAEVSSLLRASGSTKGFFDRGPRFDGLLEAADLEPGARIGSWRIVRIIGHGGMGAVYEAARAEGGFDQRAALKVIPVEASIYLARFEDERRIVARLEHPGIARLYDGGLTPAGHPFMAMELVDGEPVTAWARARSASLAARLALFAEVCEAVAYAHRNLVVHLDIKPANVLVTGEGRARLLDFGAARVLEAGLPEGAPAAMLTPAYAAPEQLAGEPVTTSTDVYSLGVLLYELIAGGLPWTDGRSDRSIGLAPSAFAATLAAAPAPASRLRGDLDAIVARAMSPDPADRYADAGALGEDIQRHLRGDPIAARADSRLYVAGRTLRRYRWAALATGLVIVSLAAGVIGIAVQARRAEAERDHFEAEVARGDAAMDYVALMFRDAGDPDKAQPVLAKDVLARSAANLDRTFAGEPAKYGRAVEFLAKLYSEMTDEVGAEALERRYLASSAAAADPVTAGRVRLLLAQSLLRQGDKAGASATLSAAQAFWAKDPTRYIGEIARSRIIEGQIKKANHDLPGAIAALRLGLAEASQPSAGVAPEDVANLENSLALALMANGSFDEADQLMARVRAYWEHNGRIEDGLVTAIQNQGAIALARGDLAGGVALLHQSIDARRATFGPSGALAAAEVNLARGLLLQGKAAEAAATAVDAHGIADRFIGAKSPISTTAAVLEAVADVERGAPGAKAEIDAAVAATAASPDAPQAISLAGQARWLADHGEAAPAALERARADAMVKALGQTGLIYRPVLAQIDELPPKR